MVLTANGEVQTNEEAQMYVHDLDLFVTMQLLEDTLAVLSLGKLCEDHGYSHEWVSGQKTTVDQRGEDNCMHNGQLRTACCSQGNPPILVAFRLQHRHCRICLQHLQPKSEVTTSYRKLVRITKNPKPKLKEGWQARFG